MKPTIEALTQEQREIYERLRAHPNGAREAAMIALSTPGNNPTESTRKAQLACVEIVRKMYGGDTERFLSDYAAGKITRLGVILELSREELGLASATPENKVYG